MPDSTEILAAVERGYVRLAAMVPVLGVTKQRCHQLADSLLDRLHLFPEPIALGSERLDRQADRLVILLGGAPQLLVPSLADLLGRLQLVLGYGQPVEGRAQRLLGSGRPGRFPPPPPARSSPWLYPFRFPSDNGRARRP